MSVRLELPGLWIDALSINSDAPVLRVGAKDGIAPQSHVLEAAFLPNAQDIVAAAKSIL